MVTMTDDPKHTLTMCGKRALEVPGRGDVDCPECIQALP